MTNKFFVGATGEKIVFLRSIPNVLSKQDALELAAWIVAIADPTQDHFNEILTEVMGS